MSELPNGQQTTPPRTRRRSPFKALPNLRERDWPSQIASTIVHTLAILLVILPSLRPIIIDVKDEGAGGPGPAGGGGGGSRGTGGVRSEHIQYVAQTAPPTPVPVPRIVPPLVEVKKPEVVPPPPTPVVETAKADTAAKAAAEATAPVIGVGGGTGNDGTAGSGPGKGGGLGSGEGKGAGSGVGDGRGGGLGTVYPPSVIQIVILPLPAPGKVKPYELVAVFDVDSLGKATLLQWNKPKDDAYARRVEATLKDYRFRPAVRALDGQPVRDTVAIRASIGK